MNVRSGSNAIVIVERRKGVGSVRARAGARGGGGGGGGAAAHLDNLRVGEQKHFGLTFLARPKEKLLEVILPLDRSISLGDLDLEAVVAGHGRREARDGLAAAAAHTEQQAVAHRLADDAADARDVANGVNEHDEGHLLGIGRVEVVKVLLDHLDHLRNVGDLGVQLRISLGVHEVAVHEVGERHGDHFLPVERAVAVLVRLGKRGSHKVLWDEGVHLVVEPRAVVVVDEPVAVHAYVLVDPEPDEVGWLEARSRVGL